MLRRHYRSIVAGVCAVLAALAVWASGGETYVDGPLYDLSIAARATFGGANGDGGPDGMPVAVIAVDARSLDAEELLPFPRTFMAPQWAGMIEAVLGAGARAIGFDVIFAYSANRFRQDFDRPLLEALQKHGDKLVLARSVRTPIIETFDFLLDDDSKGYLEMSRDRDGVNRRIDAELEVTLLGETAPQRVPSLMRATLMRAGVTAMPDTIRLNPRRHEETLPTYSLIDVLRCAGNDQAALRKAFDGRVVFVGTTLPEEDRKIGPGRFLAPPRVEMPPVNPPPPDCRLARLGASDPTLSNIPGVFIHAHAAAAVLGGHVPRTVPLALNAVLAAALALLAAFTGTLFRPWIALALALGGCVALFVFSTGLLYRDIWLPTSELDLAMLGSGLAGTMTRYLVIDQRRRRVERAFGHYVPPEIVSRLADSSASLQLGGEAREVTIMFADLSGFTALSEKVGPTELMTVTNRYLGYITDTVTATGGSIDKYIGDAVMAMWGAPISDPDHARNGTRTALAAVAKVQAEHDAAKARGEVGYTVKIGLNSGPAVVGNVGGAKHFNYTAVGETVNIAARLESLPKEYGCTVVVGENTAAKIESDYLLLELDWIRVKGKEKAIGVFTPLREVAAARAEDRAFVEGFAKALANYRAGRFDAARTLWLALDDPFGAHGPSRVMAERAAEYVDAPPPMPFDGIYVRTSK